MVYRWRCRHCAYSAWSAARARTAEAAKAHVISHFDQHVRREDFGVAWECPYCDEQDRGHDSEQTIAEYKDHLFEHVEPLMEDNVHVADDIDWTGNVLVDTPLESQGADNARIHFLSPGDICIFVTTNPAKRLRLLDEELSEWPAWTIIITTTDKPLAGIDSIDLSTVPLEVVKLDKGMPLSGLGETISRVLDEQDAVEGKISFEFDILPEIIETFDLQNVFQFLHLLTSRCERADALSHYYFDPQTTSPSTVNVLDKLFGLRITANGNVFESTP